jgi:DNA (cytosine-5)-methyltransferase 1
MLLLDLCCGAGGAAHGYYLAGFDVVGVDIEPQPYYPFDFVQADAMTYPLDGFDIVHASPPCQAYTAMSNRARQDVDNVVHDHPDLLAAMIDRLTTSGLPWIVENVGGARRHMPGAITLTGGMFGLGVHRPRLFSSNLPLTAPAKAAPPVGHIGVYGRAPDGRRLWGPKEAPTHRAASSVQEARVAMGMGWGDWHGVKEAVPPAYTEHLGAQAIEILRRAA